MTLPTIYSQRDNAWSGIKLGSSNVTIGGYGCLITCMAMLCKYYGKDVNPASINQLLNQVKGYSDGNLYKWYSGVPAIYGDIKCTRIVDTSDHAVRDDEWALVDAELSAGRPVITEVDFIPATSGVDMHFVLIIEGSKGNYKVADPWYGDISELTRYGEPSKTVQQFVFHSGPIQAPKPQEDSYRIKGIQMIDSYRNDNPQGPEGNYEGYVARLLNNDRRFPSLIIDLENSNKEVEAKGAKIAQLIAQLEQTEKDRDSYQESLAQESTRANNLEIELKQCRDQKEEEIPTPTPQPELPQTESPGYSEEEKQMGTWLSKIADFFSKLLSQFKRK